MNVYRKTEAKARDALHRQTGCLTINAEKCADADMVEVFLVFYNTVITCSGFIVRSCCTGPGVPGEVKYRVPLRHWSLVSGDEKWADRLCAENGIRRAA